MRTGAEEPLVKLEEAGSAGMQEQDSEAFRAEVVQKLLCVQEPLSSPVLCHEAMLCMLYVQEPYSRCWSWWKLAGVIRPMQVPTALLSIGCCACRSHRATGEASRGRQ